MNSQELINNLSFCVFDLETTGGNHKYDKIIEIGLVKVEKVKISQKIDFLLNPKIKIPEFIQKLTAIYPEDVEDCPTIEDVIDEILEFMGDSILVAHNTSFDVPFFNSVLTRLKRNQLQNKSICTNLMTKYLIPNLMNSNLPYMSKIFNIRHKKAHRALDDAEATAKLLINYLNIFAHKKITKVNHLYYPRNRYELDRTHYHQDTPSRIIIENISSLKTLSLVTLKGKNGVTLFSLPVSNHKKQITLLGKKLNTCDWHTTTVKLYGPLVEALIHFNTLFEDLDPKTRSEIINQLWQVYLPHERKNAQLPKKAGDFLIAHHLVPEQMLILPIHSLHRMNQLVFRYPSHKKKLLQYISAKSLRLSANRLKKTSFHPLLQNFVNHYLVREKERKKDLFIFKKGLPINSPNQFIDLLGKFLKKNPNPHNYPRDYI